MHDTAVARRHRVERHGRVLALGLLRHRQRHPMKLATAALAVGLGVEGDWHRVLDLPREDAIDEVLEGIQCLAVTTDEKPRAIALDREFDALRIFLDRGDLGLFAHQLKDFDRSSLTRGPGRRVQRSCAPHRPRRHLSDALHGGSGLHRAAPAATARDLHRRLFRPLTALLGALARRRRGPRAHRRLLSPRAAAPAGEAAVRAAATSRRSGPLRARGAPRARGPGGRPTRARRRAECSGPG